MKKVKIIIVTLVCLLILSLAIFFIIKSNLKDEYNNYIVFKTAKYKSIDDVVLYNEDLNLDSELETNLGIVANYLKENYPGRTILYLRSMGGASLFNEKALYRCIQIVNGQIQNNTDMNVLIMGNGDVEIEPLDSDNYYWQVGTDIANIKVTEEQTKQIVIDYLTKNPECYEELRKGNFANTEVCTIELLNYNLKTVWKMHFSTGDSYMIIDANTGEILDSYFFSGIIVG